MHYDYLGMSTRFVKVTLFTVAFICYECMAAMFSVAKCQRFFSIDFPSDQLKWKKRLPYFVSVHAF